MYNWPELCDNCHQPGHPKALCTLPCFDCGSTEHTRGSKPCIIHRDEPDPPLHCFVQLPESTGCAPDDSPARTPFSRTQTSSQGESSGYKMNHSEFSASVVTRQTETPVHQTPLHHHVPHTASVFPRTKTAFKQDPSVQTPHYFEFCQFATVPKQDISVQRTPSWRKKHHPISSHETPECRTPSAESEQELVTGSVTILRRSPSSPRPSASAPPPSAPRPDTPLRRSPSGHQSPHPALSLPSVKRPILGKRQMSPAPQPFPEHFSGSSEPDPESEPGEKTSSTVLQDVSPASSIATVPPSASPRQQSRPASSVTTVPPCASPVQSTDALRADSP